MRAGPCFILIKDYTESATPLKNKAIKCKYKVIIFELINNYSIDMQRIYQYASLVAPQAKFWLN